MTDAILARGYARCPGETMASDSPTELVRRWQQGDQEAALALYGHYADRLVALARSRLSARLSVRVDAEDVVQSVYRSFFQRVRDGRLLVAHGGDLWSLLVALTLNKLHRQVKHHRAQKRAVEREQQEPEDAEDLQADFVAREPSPDDAVALTEILQNLLTSLRPLDRRIAEMRLSGYTVDEIATEVHRTERTVWRILERVKDQLAKTHRAFVAP